MRASNDFTCASASCSSSFGTPVLLRRLGFDLCLLLRDVQIEQVIGSSDQIHVEATLIRTALVATDEDPCLPFQVEREEAAVHVIANLRPQLLHVRVP
jgi:hypothetical protein